MLILTVPSQELWDEYNQVFIPVSGGILRLEHNLISVSKWESKTKKSFFKDDKTEEEIRLYIKCMDVDGRSDDSIYYGLTNENMRDINDYINDPMTATVIRDSGNKKKNRNGEILTSELIYYYMIALQIPVEFETWHLNRLMMLINVCSIKNEPPKKMSKKDIYAQNASLNAARQKAAAARRK